MAGRVLCSLDSVDGLRSRTTVLGKLSAVVARDSRGFESQRELRRGTTVLESFATASAAATRATR